MSFRLCLLLLLVSGCLHGCATLGGPSAAQEAFDQGLGRFNQGRYAEAVMHFQRATELEPHFGRAYLYLGRSFLNLGQWLQAIPVLRTAFRLAPDDSKQEVTQLLLDALLGGATSRFNSGNFGESVGLLQEALRLAPDNTRVRSLWQQLQER